MALLCQFAKFIHFHLHNYISSSYSKNCLVRPCVRPWLMLFSPSDAHAHQAKCVSVLDAIAHPSNTLARQMDGWRGYQNHKGQSQEARRPSNQTIDLTWLVVVCIQWILVISTCAIPFPVRCAIHNWSKQRPSLELNIGNMDSRAGGFSGPTACLILMIKNSRSLVLSINAHDPLLTKRARKTISSPFLLRNVPTQIYRPPWALTPW